MPIKKKLLFVCTVNRMRSATAEHIFSDDARFEVKSAGTDKSASVVLSRELIEWADAVIVMEKYHRNRIRKLYPELYKAKPIICLYIPDEYAFMQSELIDLLRLRFGELEKQGLI